MTKNESWWHLGTFDSLRWPKTVGPFTNALLIAQAGKRRSERVAVVPVEANLTLQSSQMLSRACQEVQLSLYVKHKAVKSIILVGCIGAVLTQMSFMRKSSEEQ